MLKNTRGGTITSIENSEELASILKQNQKQGKGQNIRLALLLGMLSTSNRIVSVGDNANRSQFSQVKWKFFLDAPFEISNKCCDVMKKKPAHDYYKEKGLKPIIATMASESRLRTQKWLQGGCNGFNLKIPTSTPMSFWTEQDVLLYIYLRKLPICSVYGDVIEDNEIDGQMNFNDLSEDSGIFDYIPVLKTTGCTRTGCVLCGFGCHLEKEGNERFVNLKETHEGLWKLLDKCTNSGVTYREAIEWVNEHGNTHIRTE